MNKTIILALAIAAASFGCADEAATPVAVDEAVVSAVATEEALELAVTDDVITEQAVDVVTAENTDKAVEATEEKVIVSTTVE